MALVRGASRNAINTNIGRLINEGYPRDQAVAIAHDHAKRSRKRKK